MKWRTKKTKKIQNTIKKQRQFTIFLDKGITKMIKITYRDHSLREWLDEKDFINNEKKLEKNRQEGGGGNPQTFTIEIDLIKWISEMRRPDICINTSKIIYKAIELYTNLKSKTY